MTAPEQVWRLLGKFISPDDADLERAACYTFHSAIAKKWREGRLLIAGDSAHQTPPFLGQGLCAGLRDVGQSRLEAQRVIGDNRRTVCSTAIRASARRMCANISNSRCGLAASSTRARRMRRCPAGWREASRRRMETIKPALGPGPLGGRDRSDRNPRAATAPR